MAIAHWSWSQSLPLSPEGLARKWWNFQPRNGCLSFWQTTQNLKFFPEWSHDLSKKVSSKSFRMPGPWTRTRIKYGSNMNNKLSQKRTRKRVWRLYSYCLSLDPMSQTSQALCFSCSCSCCSVVPGLSDYSNNKGIIIIWHLNMFSCPKEIKG